MNEATNIVLSNAKIGYTKQGGTLEILKNLNLTFNAGDFVAVVGLNGTGKSTLLKSICGLLPLLAGKVLLEGKNIQEIELTDVAKKISITLTEKIGGFNLTVFDAVAAGQMPYTNAFNSLTEQHLVIIKEAIKTVGLTGLEHKLVHELSDGLFQKTMIAKALAQQTPNILLDEPSAFLDYASKHELFLLLQKLALEEKKCILVSSHDLDLVMKYCKKVVIVSNSEAELIDVEEVKKNERFLNIGGGFI
jgi:iron complex transport system ATP-binding protein